MKIIYKTPEDACEVAAEEANRDNERKTVFSSQYGGYFIDRYIREDESIDSFIAAFSPKFKH